MNSDKPPETLWKRIVAHVWRAVFIYRLIGYVALPTTTLFIGYNFAESNWWWFGGLIGLVFILVLAHVLLKFMAMQYEMWNRRDWH